MPDQGDKSTSIVTVDGKVVEQTTYDKEVTSAQIDTLIAKYQTIITDLQAKKVLIEAEEVKN